MFSAESFHKDMLKYMAVQVITMYCECSKNIFLLGLVNELFNGACMLWQNY